MRLSVYIGVKVYDKDNGTLDEGMIDGTTTIKFEGTGKELLEMVLLKFNKMIEKIKEDNKE